MLPTPRLALNPRFNLKSLTFPLNQGLIMIRQIVLALIIVFSFNLNSSYGRKSTADLEVVQNPEPINGEKYSAWFPEFTGRYHKDSPLYSTAEKIYVALNVDEEVIKYEKKYKKTKKVLGKIQAFKEKKRTGSWPFLKWETRFKVAESLGFISGAVFKTIGASSLTLELSSVKGMPVVQLANPYIKHATLTVKLIQVEVRPLNLQD